LPPATGATGRHAKPERGAGNGRTADAVGYAKTGLLHRFPSKEALQQAVIDRAVTEVRAIAAEALTLPPGAARDRVVVTGWPGSRSTG
jgi:hypothetical protein